MIKAHDRTARSRRNQFATPLKALWRQIEDNQSPTALRSYRPAALNAVNSSSRPGVDERRFTSSLTVQLLGAGADHVRARPLPVTPCTEISSGHSTPTAYSTPLNAASTGIHEGTDPRGGLRERTPGAESALAQQIETPQRCLTVVESERSGSGSSDNSITVGTRYLQFA